MNPCARNYFLNTYTPLVATKDGRTASGRWIVHGGTGRCYNPARREIPMNRELVERLRDLAEEVGRSDGGILFVSTDETVIVETAKAMVQGGMVSYKDIGTMLYFVADMAEE
jgi:hypothetical protein